MIASANATRVVIATATATRSPSRVLLVQNAGAMATKSGQSVHFAADLTGFY